MISVTCPNPDEGAPGPSHLGTGETTNPNRAAEGFCDSGRITAYAEVTAEPTPVQIESFDHLSHKISTRISARLDYPRIGSGS